MTNKVPIAEIFSSIQGEGLFVGYKQLFIRFCGCNLNCKYCDTDYHVDNSKYYDVEELAEIVEKHSDCHSVSLTGGEPLLNVDFLKYFLPKCKLSVYLETNATLAKELIEIIDYVDYIAADIKLPSCTGDSAYWIEHDEFFNAASGKNLFAKIVFDENIRDEEIRQATELGKKYNIELILQPKNTDKFIKPDMMFVNDIHSKFLNLYKKVRVIPQIHKILEVR